MSKPKGKPAKSQATELAVAAEPGESQETLAARTLLRPTLNAALVVGQYGKKFSNIELQLTHLVAELSAQSDAVQRGDLARAETMLIAQAHSLDAIFAKLAGLAMLNFFKNFEAGDRFMRLALKAQSQSRATLETLSAVKNPPVVIAKQANVTSGPQQINNGVAREIQTKPNELLEAMMANGWTLERRSRQAQAIRRWRPWERSTGPKTTEGKRRSSRNAFNGGTENCSPKSLGC